MPELKLYTANELKATARMMELVRQTLETAIPGRPIKLKKWWGAGAVAQALLKDYLGKDARAKLGDIKAPLSSQEADLRRPLEWGFRAYCGGRGDAPGHIVGVYELLSVAGPNDKPNCEGLKNKETRTYAYRDYRDRNGHTWGYSVTILENGDKIYAQFSGTTETTTAADGSKKTTTEGVATWTGGTGRYQTVRGLARTHSLVEWAKGESKPTGVQSSSDGECWFEK